MSIDLHCHTLFSVDAYGTPEDLVEVASKAVTAIALTEHNCLRSINRAEKMALKLGMKFFPAVELDVFFGKVKCHLLGFGIDPANFRLFNLAEKNRRNYEAHFEVYYDTLVSKGFPLSREEIKAHAAVRYPGHPDPVLSHRLVDHLIEHKGGLEGYGEMKEKGVERLLDIEALHKFVIDDFGRMCDFKDARNAIHGAGGLALLAHPGKIFPENTDKQISLIRLMMESGLDGFELYHPANYEKSSFELLEELSQELGCPVSGGTDFHGNQPYCEMESCRAPDSLAEDLSRALETKFCGEF